MFYGGWDGWDNSKPTGQKDLLWQAAQSMIGGAIADTVPNAPALSSPANAATAVTRTNPAFVWNRSTGATTYSIQISTSPTFTTTIINTSGLTDTTYTYAGPPLSYGTTHYWRVAGGRSNIYGSYSSARTFVTENVSVTTPATPTLSSPTANQTGVALNLTFLWNANTDSTTGYGFQLVRADTTSTAFIVNRSSQADTFYSHIGLNTSTIYYYRVWGVKGTGAGAVAGDSTLWRKFTTTSAPPVSVASPIEYRPQVRIYNDRRSGWVVANDVVPDHLTFTKPSIDQMRKPATAGAINWYPGIGTLDSDSVYTPEGGSSSVPTTANDFTVSGELTTNGTIFANAGGELSGPYSFISGSTLTAIGTVNFTGAVQTGLSADSLGDRAANRYLYITDSTFRTGQTSAISTPVTMTTVTTAGLFEFVYYYNVSATGTADSIAPVLSWNDGIGAKTYSATILPADATTRWQSSRTTVYVAANTTPSWTTTMGGTGTYNIYVTFRRTSQ
jgi:hypothetical protein